MAPPEKRERRALPAEGSWTEGGEAGEVGRLTEAVTWFGYQGRFCLRLSRGGRPQSLLGDVVQNGGNSIDSSDREHLFSDAPDTVQIALTLVVGLGM